MKRIRELLLRQSELLAHPFQIVWLQHVTNGYIAGFLLSSHLSTFFYEVKKAGSAHRCA
jgi:hypothetical protein